MSEVVSIAIIGLGPKGLHSLERLLAELAANPVPAPVTVHVINRSPQFGVSPVYDTTQPNYILTNNSVGDIDTWTAEPPTAVGGRGPNFIEWHAHHIAPGQPRLTGGEYLPRALVGRYLCAGFQHLQQHVPDGVKLRLHIGEAEDLWADDDHHVIAVRAADGRRTTIIAHKILLATGHSRVTPSVADRAHAAFATSHATAMFIPFAYPVVETLRGIPAGARVAMKGMGLTFIDAALELTEGRGGRFEPTEDGVLNYVRSGREPSVILPFGRSGLPVIPKAADLPLTLRPLVFTCPERLRALRARASGRKLDYATELEPWVELEMQRVYYQVAMGPGSWRDRLESAGDDGPTLRRLISGFLAATPSQAAFDPTPVLDPLAAVEPTTAAEYHTHLVDYLAREIDRARLGHRGSPLKAAIDVWYEIRYALQTVLEFGGLTPASHAYLNSCVASRYKRVVFGPPLGNAAKILALARAGVVDFGFAKNPDLSTSAATGRFELHSRLPVQSVTSVDVLIDARVLGVDLAHDSTPLYQSLLARQLVRPFANDLYQSGAIDMTPGSQFVIGRDGDAHPDIAVIGIPTEGNLVGNLTVTRSPFSCRWARQTLAQLHERTRNARFVMH